jgi:hypothetical protein
MVAAHPRRRGPRRAQLPTGATMAYDTRMFAMPPFSIRGRIAVGSVLLIALLGACSRDEPTPKKSLSDKMLEDPIEMQGKPPKIDFPADVRCDDESINDFIDELIRICLQGEYGRYRLAVSTKVDPIDREQFRRAWQAVEKVEVRRIVKIWPPPGKPLPTQPAGREELLHPIYGVHARITLREQPGRSERARTREVVVLVIQENGEWKLGPPAGRDIKYRIMGIDAATDDGLLTPTTTSAPADLAS